MNTRFLFTTDDRFMNGKSKITNVPADAGFIPKIMMKKLTLLCLFVLFAVSGLMAQVPNGPVTFAGEMLVPTPVMPVTVSVPVTVNNFNNVGDISLTIDFNPAVLQMTGATFDVLAFPGMTVIPNNLIGQVIIGWYGVTPAPVLPNGSVLLTLNFTYSGGTSLIKFNDATNGCEYADGLHQYYLDTPFDNYYHNGYVSDLSATATYTNSCASGNIGQITVTASGGTGQYQYSIDNGTTWLPTVVSAPYTPYTFSNLAPGAYQVLVRDVALSLPLVTFNVGMVSIPVHNTTQNTYYCTIQDAVNAANPNDNIIIVASAMPWTFTENVTINKPLTITGNPANPANAVIDAANNGSVVTFSANGTTFSGFTIVNSGTLAGDAGVAFNNVSNVTVTGNVVKDNTNGFVINGSFNTGNNISQNQIFDNGMGMLLNLASSTELVNASYNWWGHATGPFNAIHNSCGLGNGVSNNVVFQPWYTNAAMTTTATLPITNIDKATFYCTIQDAVDHADNGNTIHFLAPGNYGNLNFNYAMSLTIENVSSGVVTMHGASSALTVSAGDLTFNGVDFTTATNDPTVLVSAGKLTMRNCNVWESTAFDNVGVLITGGELDAGTSPMDPGHNRFFSDGSGLSMNNTGGIVNAIHNHWGHTYYMIISPKIQGNVPFDPWCNYDFTVCNLSRFGGPITYAPKVVTIPGAVSLPITVDQFANVDAISLTLHYNPAIITYTGFTANPVFPGMFVNIPTPGIVKIAWFGNSPVTSLPDGSTIVDLGFSFVGGTSLLEWKDVFSVDCEYQNALIQYPYIDTPQANFYYDGYITDLAATSVTSTNVICKGTASGTITINGASGGSGAYEYSVDGGLTWQSANLFYVIAGTYDVWIRDAGFPVVAIQLNPALTIIEPALPLTASATWTKRVRCKGESNGEALVTANGGWGGLTYLWSDPLGQKTAAADSLAAGFYTVTITDAGGCSITASTFVIEPTNAFTATVTSTVVACKGAHTGTITVNAAHGWGYYMYSINNITYYNYLTSNTITGLPAGNYTVHVFDDERCELYLPVSIQEPAVALSATAVQNKPVSCYGFTDGEILVAPLGGWGSYEFSLDGGVTYQAYAGNLITNLAAGTYTIHVKDLHGCVVVTSATVVQPAPFLAEITGDNTLCYGQSSTVTINITGGNAPYNFQITDGTNTITQTGYAGTTYSFTQPYTTTTTWSWVYINDNNSCPAVTSGSATITVNPLPELGFSFQSLATTASVFDYCYNETVTATLSHVWAGTAPFNISWTVNGTPYSLTGVQLNDALFSSIMAPGTYVVQITGITDANGCTPTSLAPYTATVNVHDEPMISFGFNGVEAGHNASFEYCYDEMIGVTLYGVYGGTAPYSVTYTVNGTPTTVTGLTVGSTISPAQLYAAGVYNIVVTDITDVYGCKASASFLSLATATITVRSEPMFSFGFNGVEAGHNATFQYCYDQPIGVTLHSIYGGTAPYSLTYTVNGGTPITVTGLDLGDVISPVQLYAPGVYNIVVTDITDVYGCKASAAFLNLATATVIVRDEPMFSFGFNGVEAGHNAAFQYCYNETIGVTLHSIYGGTAPYSVTYTVNGGTPITVTGLNLGDVISPAQLYAPGVYNIVVTDITDVYGCKASTSFLSLATATVTVRDEPMFSFGFNGVEAGHNATFQYCYNETIGVTLHSIYGGTAPYSLTYTVNGGTPITVTGLNLGDVISPAQLYTPGVYNIVVTDITDVYGCKASPAFLSLATATVTVRDEPMFSFGFNGVEAGHNAAFQYCYNETIGVTLHSIYGGTAPYSVTYTVNGGTPITVTGLNLGDVISPAQFYAPGVYNIVVTDITDVYGCKASTTFLSLATATVTVRDEPMFSFGFNGVEAGHNATFQYCYNETIGVTLHSIYGGTAPYSLTYTVNGGTPITVTGLYMGDVISPAQLYTPGVYNIVVTDITDVYGCKASASFLSLATATVTVRDEPMISFGFNGVEAGHNASFEYCFDQPVGVTLYGIYGGTAPYSVTYELNGSPVTVNGLYVGDVISPSQLYAAGVYNIVVTDITDVYGCKASAGFLSLATAVVTINAEPAIGLSFNGTLAGTGSVFDFCYSETVTVDLSHIWAGIAPFNVAYTIDNGSGPVAYTATALNLNSILFTGTYAPGTYTVQITSIVDAKGCSPANYTPYVATVNIHSYIVSGTFAYHNAFQTPLNNVSVALKQGSTTLYTTITDINGGYQFPAVCPGTYEVVASTLKPVGGINSTDAVQVNTWGVTPSTIEKVQFRAGDVIYSNTIFSNDAGRILQYFVQNGSPAFSTAPWVFWKAYETIAANPFVGGPNPAITITTANLNQDFYGLVSGDFNRSFIPGGAKLTSTVTLNNHGSYTMAQGEELEIPVIAENAFDMTATSLILHYPADKVEVMGVTLDGSTPVMFSANNGELRIGHSALMATQINAGQALLKIRVKALAALVAGEMATFTLVADPLNEIAGSDYTPLTQVILNIGVIEGTVGVVNLPASAALTIASRPNPFNHATTLTYDVPSQGVATLEMYDLVGRKVMDLFSGMVSEGSHTLQIDGSLITPGVYMVAYRLTTDQGALTRTIKVVKN